MEGERWSERKGEREREREEMTLIERQERLEGGRVSRNSEKFTSLFPEWSTVVKMSLNCVLIHYLQC